MHDIGQAIIERREELRLSQKQLAELAGMHRNTVGRIERGVQKPNQSSLEIICQALDLTVFELYQRAGLNHITESYKTDPVVTRCKMLLDRLPPERQLEFVELLDKLIEIFAEAR